MSEMLQTIPYEDLVFASSHLCELLEIENEALACHDPDTVRVLADNKAALARLFEHSAAPLADDPSLIETLEPEQQEELRELSLRLNELVTVNARRLKAEMEACRRVMDVVVNAVKKHSSSKVTYGRAGVFDAAAKGSPNNCISLNRTL